MINSSKLKKYIIAIFFSVTFFYSASALKAEIKVVTTIQPLHSLVANVMDGSGDLGLILEGSASPHNFSLKPSHARMLEKADVIFWFGEDLETFLEKSLKTISTKAKIISFMKLNEIPKLKFREKNIFKHDDHDDHKDEHKDGHDDHKDEHGHKDAHGHAHGEFDVHLWLDPINAKLMVKEIAHVLSEIDPSNAKKYNENADKTSLKIDIMVLEINKSINKKARFITFHDAYQYFEKRFKVPSMGALTVNTDVQPGAKQISKIRKHVKEENIKCIFSEPQFNPKIINVIAESTNIKTGVFDPLGSTFKPGKSLYFSLIKDLSKNLSGC
tara:strand:- start:544 stop:1527 length:984 start_codon:yes stop_codon:yes gene_type:complete